MSVATTEMSRSRLAGSATPEGTSGLLHRMPAAAAQGFYKHTRRALWLSSIGVGTYLGEATERGDELYAESIRLALKGGLNVVDTAIKYRKGRSERVVGQVLAELSAAGVITRREVFVSTKGGLISVPDGEEPKQYIESAIVKRLGVSPDAITDDAHCIAPAFIQAQLEASLEQLGLSCIDCYFLHNVETALARMPRGVFEKMLAEVFELLETAADAGRIQTFGLASWTGFRAWRDSWQFLDLEQIYAIACRVNSSPRFAFVQVPLSIGMPASYQFANQTAAGALRSTIDAACALGLDVFTSGSVYGGKLTELYNLFHLVHRADGAAEPQEPSMLTVSLPQGYASLVQLFQLLLRVRDQHLDPRADVNQLSRAAGPYAKALDVVRSIPEVTTALVGGEDPRCVTENLELAAVPVCSPSRLAAFWQQLGGCG